ncbi:uncharacterized protein LOC127807673 [Diospyros lotus]|uniref:uncharacterized protein LOC127807673 n=1 Tax=Diospyros lotus TaxID=55363 RepID=UPI002255F1BD|nr:uncharacterized protein LOC127807673 [Diospyros lotus]
MATGKAAGGPPRPNLECCMCGDYGLSSELFNCKVCQFRSQHRYCSNLYPGAESYRVCNWCLKEEATEKTQNHNSSDSSPSRRSGGGGDDKAIKTKKKNGGSDGNHGGLKRQKGALMLQQAGSPIKKKQASPEGSPSPSGAAAAQKRAAAAAAGSLKERLRRTKSDQDIAAGRITKPVYRNKVRRYKLLDEVSSQ